MKMEKKVLRAQVKGSQPGHFTTCLACKAKITWAKDDRFPERNIGDLINVEPNPDKTGTIVLWYEITAKGKSIGPQWFREILEHLGLPSEAPEVAPARSQPQGELPR